MQPHELAVKIALDGRTPQEKIEIMCSVTGKSPADYAHLDNGRKSMTAANVLRAAIKNDAECMIRLTQVLGFKVNPAHEAVEKFMVLGNSVGSPSAAKSAAGKAHGIQVPAAIRGTIFEEWHVKRQLQLAEEAKDVEAANQRQINMDHLFRRRK